MRKWCHSLIRFQLLAILMVVLIQASSQSLFTDLEDSLVSSPWINAFILDSTEAHSGIRAAFTDPTHPYGLGIETTFPEDLKGQNIILQLDGWVRCDTSHPEATYVWTIEENGKIIFWQGILLKPLISQSNQWQHFQDSILIPAAYTRNSKLKAYCWNNSPFLIALDDLRFTFSKHQHVSFLPKLATPFEKVQHQGRMEILYQNDYYRIAYFPAQEKLQFIGSDGSLITEALYYLTEKTVDGASSTLVDKWKYLSTKTKKSQIFLRFTSNNKHEKIHMTFICNPASPKLDIEISSKYKSDQDIHRSALVMDVNSRVTEVMRSNRKSDTSGFQAEYWLDKQGLRFGKGASSLIIYHQPEISSLQLASKERRLFINLDYEKDHPFFRFPLMPDSMDWKLEQSYSHHKKGEKQKNNLSLYLGSNQISMARIMKNPNGFEATYIWTEHADFTNIQTNRATYFGSEAISKATDAIGGFVKFGIPVTKSVFYDNPDSIRNDLASNGQFHGFEAAYKTDTAFRAFLEDIKKHGHEICLHTPDHFTTSPGRLEEALIGMKQEFGSSSWIDHGYNNKPQNNRENLMCDGADPKSEHYALKQWENHDIRFFWNAYYEDGQTFIDWQFNSSIEKPSRDYGDFLPVPDYFQHPTRTGNLYHWPTASALFVNDASLWDYLFNEQKLRHFVDNWGVEINHCYPAWAHPAKGFWTYNGDSVIVAQDGFNATLAVMSKLRDEGKLNLCTIGAFMDYQLATDDLEYDILLDGRILVSNQSEQAIQGLSFATKAKHVLVNRLKPLQKTSGNDLIFWFDLEAGESKTIRLIE